MTNYASQPWDDDRNNPWINPGANIPQEDRTAAAFAHGATLISMIVSAGWLSFVGPLLVYVLYKDRSPYVRRAAAGAFNFNIWANIMMIVGWLLFISIIGAPVGIPLMVVSGIMQVWCHLHATLRSLRGKHYKYPFQTHILS